MKVHLSDSKDTVALDSGVYAKTNALPLLSMVVAGGNVSLERRVNAEIEASCSDPGALSRRQSAFGVGWEGVTLAAGWAMRWLLQASVAVIG
jgi:hypothetical protein